jgi:transcriptional regulator with XRE-family HTH domain
MNGQKLHDLRVASGKTLRQLSRESDVTEAQILNLESGKTTNPRIETLQGLARALGCELNDFLL